MTSLPRETLLCSYRYDPLNRSMDWAPDQHASIQRFYCKSRLTTELQGAAKYSLLQHDDQVLAQQRQMGDNVDTTLLATDLQRSVLNALNATPPQPFAYTPYGHRPLANGLLSLLGFNGERPDPVTGHYHLGNGYRQFNPVLMRFNGPDSWSPFGEGGLNAYSYCLGDPINRVELDGHSSSLLISLWKGWKNRIGVRTPSKYKVAKPTSTPNKFKKPTTQMVSQESPQSNALANAPVFDLNKLSPAEIDLNYKQIPSTKLETPILVRHITDTNEKLHNLQLAKKNVSNRLASDTPNTRRKRQVLLNSIDSSITELNDQVTKIRSQNPAISI
jgi:RHS repeat-associated protein